MHLLGILLDLAEAHVTTSLALQMTEEAVQREALAIAFLVGAVVGLHLMRAGDVLIERHQRVETAVAEVALVLSTVPGVLGSAVDVEVLLILGENLLDSFVDGALGFAAGTTLKVSRHAGHCGEDTVAAGALDGLAFVSGGVKML